MCNAFLDVVICLLGFPEIRRCSNHEALQAMNECSFYGSTFDASKGQKFEVD